MLAWRRLNLQDPTRGLSPLSAIRYDIAYSRHVSEKRTQQLVNWNVPPGAWVIPKDAEWSPQDEGIVKRVLRTLRGPKGAGKTPILPKGLTWQAIALSPQDSAEIENGKISRMQVCAALGVPLVLAGDDEKTSVYRNMVDAERVFARYMIYELDWTADGFNGWLVPDFDPTRKKLVVAFDYTGIESLQAPLEDRKRVALQEIQNSARTPDEYRAEFRLGQELPDGVGKKVYQLLQVAPVGEGNPVAAPETTQPTTDDGDALRSAFRVARKDYDRTGDLTPISDLLGIDPSPALREGLRRRYTPEQLLNGVPREGFEGLRERTAA
jgi:hypothetical protein